MQEKKMAEVVAALIWQQDKFLICQRPANKALPLLWEFAGGKVELGESKEQALVRECKEELGITVQIGEVFAKAVYAYPDITVHLTLFQTIITAGKPQMLEHMDMRWITVAEIPNYAFCPADADFLVKLQAEC